MTLRDIRIVAQFGLHPYSPSSRQVSPCILYLKVSWSTGSHECVQGLILMRPHQWMSPMTPYRHFGGLPGGCTMWAHPRCDLDPIASMAGSVDIPVMFRRVSVWLRDSRASQSSALTAPSSGSVRTICGIGGWPRRHCQQCLLHSIRVNVTAARRAVLTISVSISITIAVASPLALSTQCNRLACSTVCLGITISRALDISASFPSPCTSVCAFDASVSSPTPFGLSGGVLALRLDISASVLMLWASPCPIDASTWVSMPFVSMTPRFASPALR
ncbi:hypothetical protein SCLCIDRAFT_20303 [Scleroderma citrinum Foug A]|uniref:Uncharacterized protein n=1 Tax=Scleroderma citrinum Foug A TaxID=1036808 RepID=A0A0C3EJE9_9AGAM|nr:hypothetical protein SCLCIDRAFT_20303 [Scleroderma citrinum Foug A]